MSKRGMFELPAGVLFAALPCALLTVGGMYALLAFDGTSGQKGPSPVVWPEASGIARVPGEATLLLFAHPSCPCTRATLYELSQILDTGHPAARVRTRVLFVRPAGSWQPTDTWRQAEAIPGGQVAWDEDGVEARRFGAKTSGMVLLYGPDGRLAFEGGVTGARGHIGDNYGIERLRAALPGADLQGGSGVQPGNPVFGCSLAMSDSAEAGTQ